MSKSREPKHLADISRFIYWDPDIGLEQSHFFGFHGSGKSNLAHLVLSYCLENGEMGLMRGSMNCEWRHFLLYDYPMKMLIPKQLKPIENSVTCLLFNSLDHLKREFSFNWDYFDPEKVDIIKHLEPGGILVIYDEPFSLASRGWFWAKTFKKLKYRIEKHTIPVAYVEHEAGILFPEVALSESKKAQSHWCAVNEVCEMFVDFRKNFIRSILISQLESEVNHRLRDKCIYAIIKKGVVGKRYPEEVRKEAPQQRVDQFISSVGKELYIRGNESPKFDEISEIWKMVPSEEYQDIELYLKEEEVDDKMDIIKILARALHEEYGESIRAITNRVPREKSAVGKWVSK